ncbi:hypothetical protein [Halomonas sp. QHL1]|uniref:hypothetical protein n=1 Tax=Halomonas sp. QHL1 TaxID=1123773 RepID=UPI000A8B0A88|nr:hypothetical protein [Halomonas sp. QHL1]
MSPSLYLGATGFGLIAVCYGFARFAFGLFLPQIDADVSLSSTVNCSPDHGRIFDGCVQYRSLVFRWSARHPSAGLEHDRCGLLWIAIGAAGIAGAGAGAGAGTLVASFGIDRTHWLFLAALAAGIMLVGTSITTPLLALCGGMLFGAAYIMLTGVYLIWGVSALSDRPATGLMIGFLTIAIVQTSGAPIFGLLMEQLNIDYAVTIFACLAFTAGLARAGNAQLEPA